MICSSGLTFQSTLPRGERRNNIFLSPLCYRFQSTLPRGERQRRKEDKDPFAGISIHAPARGATRSKPNFYPDHKKFQSTLPRGERQKPNVREYLRHLISIHAPARGATSNRRMQCFSVSISIHAPARGATKETIRRPRAHGDFNPRSREGSDGGRWMKRDIRFQFQSTLPRGERQEQDRKYLDRIIISIHAPARGATTIRFFFIELPPISIHAPARGATRSKKGCYRHTAISIHAPARGATEIRWPEPTHSKISIHAPARGATYQTTDPALQWTDFNPRSREGSDVDRI